MNSRFRRLLILGAAWLGVTGMTAEAPAQCSCDSTPNPSFPRTLLTAYVGEYDAWVAAQGVDGKAAGLLRGISRLFRKCEELVRKAQLDLAQGKLERAQQRFDRAQTLVDKLAERVDDAAVLGLLGGSGPPTG